MKKTDLRKEQIIRGQRLPTLDELDRHIAAIDRGAAELVLRLWFNRAPTVDELERFERAVPRSPQTFPTSGVTNSSTNNRSTKQ